MNYQLFDHAPKPATILAPVLGLLFGFILGYILSAFVWDLESTRLARIFPELHSEPQASVTEQSKAITLEDSLGIPYAVSVNNSDVVIEDWETYIDVDGNFALTAIIRSKADITTFREARAVLRMYGSDDKLIQVLDLGSIAYNLEPGDFHRFSYAYPLDPIHVSRYSLAVDLLRW